MVQMLRVSEVAKLLQVDRSTLYKLIQSGEIPAVRIAGRIRVPENKLIDRMEPVLQKAK